jgi:hypothetical protein
MDLIKETAKLQLGPGGSAAELADVVLESPNNQNEPSTLRPLRNDGHGKHNRRHRRKEENRSYCRYSQLRYFDRPSRTRSRIRRKYQNHVMRQEPRHRRQYKNRSRRQYQPGSRSLKLKPRNLNRFLCLCSLFCMDILKITAIQRFSGYAERGKEAMRKAQVIRWVNSEVLKRSTNNGLISTLSTSSAPSPPPPPPRRCRSQLQ